VRFPEIRLSRVLESIVDGPFGSNLASSHYTDEGARVVRLGNIGMGRFKDEKRAYVALEHYERLERHSVAAGDVLIAGLGDEQNSLGRACIAPDDLGLALVKADCFRARFDRERVDPRFIVYFLCSTLGARRIEDQSRGSTRSRATPGAVASIDVPLPDQAEQQRIADFLDQQVNLLDTTIGLRHRQEALMLSRRAAGVLAEVTGAGHESGQVGGLLPWAERTAAAWPIAKITYHARLGSGHTPSRNRADWWTDCIIPWVTTGEVWQMRSDRLEDIVDTRERISLLGMQNSSAVLHSQGTVVLCRTAASAGYSAVMGADMATSQDLMAWTCGPTLNPYYLLWCLRAMRSDLLSRLATGSTHKTIYVPDIQTLRIPVPPRPEQDVVVQRIRHQNAQIDRLVDLGREHIGLLEERKQALITAAVIGEFDVSTARSVA
jgi:type I restriction enzyme S subunit